MLFNLLFFKILSVNQTQLYHNPIYMKIVTWGQGFQASSHADVLGLGDNACWSSPLTFILCDMFLQYSSGHYAKVGAWCCSAWRVC